MVTVIEFSGQSDLKYNVYFGPQLKCTVPHGRAALAIGNQAAARIAAIAEWDQCSASCSFLCCFRLQL